MDIFEVGGLHHAGAFGAAKTHAGKHSETAEDMVITCFCIVVKGCEGRLGEAAHVIGERFDEEYAAAAFVWHRAPLTGAEGFLLDSEMKNMFVEDHAEDTVVVAFKEVDHS